MLTKVRLIYQGPAQDAGPDLESTIAALASALSLPVEQARELLAHHGSQLGGEMDLGHAGKLADQLRALGLQIELVKAEPPTPEELPAETVTPEAVPPDAAPPEAAGPLVISGKLQVPASDEPSPEAPASEQEPADNLLPEHFDGTDMAKARVLAGQLQDSGHPPPAPAAPPPASAAEEPATKICPFCAETILAAAVKCKHCGEFLGPHPVLPAAEPVASGGEAAAAPASTATDTVEEAIEVKDTLDLSHESKILTGTEPEDVASPADETTPASESKALPDAIPEGWAEPPPERPQGADNA